MFRKIVAVWVSLAMLFGFVVILDVVTDITPQVKAATLYVNTTGSNGAYTSIQDAINASNNGDTVFVYNGTYYENVVVNKTINLTGEDRDTTIIDGSNVGDVMSIDADYVKLSTFTINNGGNDINNSGIKVNSNFNSIYDANITSNNFCVYINYSIGNEIYNISARMCSKGIYLFYSNGNDLINNIFNDNKNGILLEYSDENNITGNTFFVNPPSLYNGIGLTSSRNNSIEGNIISNEMNGISLSHSDENDILNNTISDCHAGINQYTSGWNNIIDNKISDSSIGIYLTKSVGINITDNTLMRNGILIWGDLLEYWNTHTIGVSNTINGKPMYYLKNQTGGIVPPGTGEVILANCTNIMIENQELTYATIGIEIGFSSDNTIIGNNASQNYYHGIQLYRSHNNTVDDNNASHCYNHGIYVQYSNNSRFNNNNASFNGQNGITLYYSNNNNISDCHVSYNDVGIGIDSATGNEIRNNYASSNDFYGIFITESNASNVIGNNASSSTRGIFIKLSNDINISGNEAYWNYMAGILLESSHWNNITDNTIGLCTDFDGIYLEDSNNNNLINNTGFSNNRDGISIYFSDSNLIMGNNLISNWDNGISISYSNWNNVTYNNVSDNYGDGIELLGCWWTNITNNEVFSNDGSGIYLWGMANYNYITYNNISSSLDYGVCLEGSSWNRIYHNNIIINTNQAFDDQSDNEWDNEYPLGGNFWSDYGGTDIYKGPNQDIPSSDGIGDTPYVIDADSKDNYPLMSPPTPLENHSILKEGWNLISVPLIQEEQNLTRVLGSIDSWYDAVQCHDISDKGDLWKHYRPGKPFGNDLSLLNESIGFWIHITQPGDTIFAYNGTQPSVNQTIKLYPGWNLVGYPSLSNRNRTTALNNIIFGQDVDAIWTFNAATQTWQEIGPSDYFELGRGYWIHSKVTKIWDVPL